MQSAPSSERPKAQWSRGVFASEGSQARGRERSKERLTWLDYAKGIGIMLVVLGHIVRGLVDNSLVSANDPRFQWFDFTLYTFHMPLFFLISGMTAEASLERGKRNFIKGKIWTIAFPYVLWSLLFGTLRVLFSSKDVTWDRLAWIGLYPMSIFWFLYVLFLCHMAFAFFPAQRRYFLFGASAGALIVSEFVPQDVKNIWPPLFYFFWAMPFYMAGHFLRKTATTIAVKVWAVPLLALAFATSVLVAHAVAQWRYQSIFAVPAGIFGIALVIALARVIRGKAGLALTVLSAASMTIYVSHTLIASIARKLLDKAHINSVPINIFILFLICIGLPVLAYFSLKRFGLLHVFGLAAPKFGKAITTQPALGETGT